MSIYKRGKIWYVQITCPNGQRIQRSTGTGVKENAQEFHDQLKADLWRVHRLGEKPIYYWENAVINWLDDKCAKKSLNTDIAHFHHLDKYLAGMQLDHIRKPVIKEFITDRQLSGVSLATIDRSLALLKSVLNLARTDEMIDKVPSIKLFKPDNQITRFITKAEAAKLISKSPDWLADLIIMSLSTGLRESDLLGLEWRRVDLKRRHAWIERQTTKGVKSIPIPMNDEAWLIVLKYANQHPQYVFTKDGEKIQKAGGNEWKKALKRAKIDKFRWHDLRHTWASWHVQAGTPLRDLMDLGGWSNMQMVLRYAHLRNDDLERHKDNSLIFVDSNDKTPTPLSSSSAICFESLSKENANVVKNSNVIPLFSKGNQYQRIRAF